MPTNSYFSNYTFQREQDLLEDLCIESIRMYGIDVKYLPRDTTSADNLFGEDPLATFDQAADVEIYVKNVEGFDGEGEFLSKFNLEIRDSVTFTIARKRWDQIRTSKLLLENGSLLVKEDGNTDDPSRQYLTGSGEYDNLVLDTTDPLSITSERPYEGDLIYFPLDKRLYQIKFVEHEQVFYQMGRLQTYDLRCELFEYSSETIDTGISDIDALGSNSSQNSLVHEILLEDGVSVLLKEDGGSLLQEFRVETTAPTANNEFFDIKMRDDVIEFSESNVFGFLE